MKRNLILSLMVLVLSIGLADCKSKKVACPAYGGPSAAPGAIPKSSRTQSGVMPGDGRGKKTKLPR